MSSDNAQAEFDGSDPLSSLNDQQEEALCEQEWNKAKKQIGIDGWCRWFAHVKLVEFKPVTDSSARDRCNTKFDECKENPATCKGGFGGDQCSATVDTALTCQRAYIDETENIIADMPSCDSVEASYYKGKSKADFRPSNVEQCDKLESECPDFYSERYESSGEFSL